MIKRFIKAILIPIFFLLIPITVLVFGIVWIITNKNSPAEVVENFVSWVDEE